MVTVLEAKSMTRMVLETSATTRHGNSGHEYPDGGSEAVTHDRI